jgi:aspartyl-tRNA synthetase
VHDFRTPSHNGKSISNSEIGKTLSLCGWIDVVRDHGEVLFVDLRDNHSTIQVLFSKEFCPHLMDSIAKIVKTESVIWCEGKLRIRPEGTENPKENLGRFELCASELKVISAAETPAFPIKDESTVHEQTLLKYRYLHLRSPRMQRNIKNRSQLLFSLRKRFHDLDFTEVETPTLFKSTPEGARDFLVPSRLHLGKFYALIQSPQMLKQLLMIGGMGRYMQIARCYRDEDSRSDRQPEFTQLDLEASFLDQKSFQALVEKEFLGCLNDCSNWSQSFSQSDIPDCIPRISYTDAMEYFGSDKPDIRFPLPLTNVTHVFQRSEFAIFRNIADKNGLIQIICVPASYLKEDIPRTFLDGLPNLAKSFGGQGLAWVRIQDDGTWQGPAAKFFSDEEKQTLLASARVFPDVLRFSAPKETELGSGTMLFFCGHTDKQIVAQTLGSLRLKLCPQLSFPETNRLALLWVNEWPLFEWNATHKRMGAAHHPFTSPAHGCLDKFMTAKPDDAATKTALADIKAQAFDLVFNGTEVGGGSVRIHSPEVQTQMFSLLGMNEQTIRNQFGFFVDALRYGTPPHVGMALGIDRLAALLLNEESIRDVIAFPKTGSGTCLMSNSPSEVSGPQLKELGWRTLNR